MFSGSLQLFYLGFLPKNLFRNNLFEANKNHCLISFKYIRMTTFLLLKDLYQTSFEELNNRFAAGLFKFMSILSFVGLMIVLYAFIYRLATGFPF